MVAAIAAPIVTALGGGAVASFGVNLALYAGVSAASILLQMSMATEQKQEIGTKLDAVIGGAVNQSFHFGEKESAGSFIYKGSWGISNRVPNAFLVRVFCLGDRPVSGFKSHIWGAGRKCNYDAGETQIVDGVNLGHPINAFDSSGGHRLWVKFHDGSQTSADNYLVEKFGDHPKWPWTEDHIGRGRPYMIVTQKYDKKQPEGEIEVLAVLEHAKFYDWREDSTNGGSGSQRYGNYGTYGVDPGNPVVTAQNVMRGIEYSNSWLFGGQGWPKTRFDNDTWTAAANKCDTNVSLAGGGNQKWARAGGEIDVSEEPWTVVERLLKACNGRLVESGGVFKIHVGGIGASVWSVTDGDIIVSEELTGRLFPTREEIANTVNGTYIEPANAGEAKAFKPRTNADYVAQDGDVRKTAVDYDYVRDNVQAQRMAVHALREGRRFRTFVLAFWTEARKLEPCDVISWTSDRYQFEDKKFIVGDVILRADGVVIVNLREADNADSDWETSDEDAFETGVFEEEVVPPQTLTATVTATAITDDDDVTERRPAIRIEATVDDEFVDCRALRYQVRKRFGDQRMIYRGRSEGFFEPGDDDYGDVTFTSNAFISGRHVQVRFKIEPESDRDTDWSDWADHTVTLTDVPEVNDDLPPDLAVVPTLTLTTKIQRSGEVVQRLLVDLDLTGRDGKEGYVIRVANTTDGEATRYETREFPFPVPVLANHSYEVRVRPVSRFGVPGNLSGLATGVSMPIPKKSTLPTVASGLETRRWPGGIRNKWTLSTEPDYKETALLKNTVNNSATATEIWRGRGNSHWDPDISKGVRYYYWALDYDTSDNPAASTSSGDDDINFGITVDDTDTIPLGAVAGVSIVQKDKDVDRDGTIDIAFLASCSALTYALDYEMEISWSTSSGGSYTVLNTLRSPDRAFWFKANTNLWYRVRARAILFNNVVGAWSSYSSAVKPAPKTSGPSAPSGVFASPIELSWYIYWTAPSEQDYFYSEIAILASAGTPADSNVIAMTSGRRLYVYYPQTGTPYYIYVRHVNTSGVTSGWTLASGSPVGVARISQLAANTVDTTELVNGSVTQAKLDALAAGDMSIHNSGTGGASLAVGPASRTLLVGSWRCTNNATDVIVTIGSQSYPNITFDNNGIMAVVSVENSGGTFTMTKDSGTWGNCRLAAVKLW